MERAQPEDLAPTPGLLAERPLRVLVVAGSDRRQYNWRELRVRLGLPRAGSSPAKQRALGLHRDR